MKVAVREPMPINFEEFALQIACRSNNILADASFQEKWLLKLNWENYWDENLWWCPENWNPSWKKNRNYFCFTGPAKTELYSAPRLKCECGISSEESSTVKMRKGYATRNVLQKQNTNIKTNCASLAQEANHLPCGETHYGEGLETKTRGEICSWSLEGGLKLYSTSLWWLLWHTDPKLYWPLLISDVETGDLSHGQPKVFHEKLLESVP